MCVVVRMCVFSANCPLLYMCPLYKILLSVSLTHRYNSAPHSISYNEILYIYSIRPSIKLGACCQPNRYDNFFCKLLTLFLWSYSIRLFLFVRLILSQLNSKQTTTKINEKCIIFLHCWIKYEPDKIDKIVGGWRATCLCAIHTSQAPCECVCECECEWDGWIE